MARLVENWLQDAEKMGIIVQTEVGKIYEPCRWDISLETFEILQLIFHILECVKCQIQDIEPLIFDTSCLSRPVVLNLFSMYQRFIWVVEVSSIAGIFFSTQMVCFLPTWCLVYWLLSCKIKLFFILGSYFEKWLSL